MFFVGSRNRQVVDSWPGSQVSEQLSSALLLDREADFAVGIAEVAEHARAGGANRDAHRLKPDIDALDTPGALLGDADRTLWREHEPIVPAIVLPVADLEIRAVLAALPIEGAYAVGAGGEARAEPMQRSKSMSTMPSSRRNVALTGHTRRHGASVQC